MLSWMLLEGEIIAPDHAEARRWAEAAAAQGIAASMTRLGMIHHNALGVERNPSLAAQWWDKAAARGDADAQAMLGAAFHLGAGVARDPVAALAWLLRGHKGGSALAVPFLDAVRASMTPLELARANELAEQPLPEPVA
jgi:TPR repeat protein